MLQHFRQIAMRNVVSPIGLAMLSYALFLVGWVFPPDLYGRLVSEPDLMFLDSTSLIYYSLCTGAFIFGAACYFRFGLRSPKSGVYDGELRVDHLYLPIPIAIATVLCGLYLAKVGSHMNVVSILASQQGGLIKEAQSSWLDTGSWDFTLMILTTTLCWATYRARQYQLKGFSRTLYLSFFWLGVTVDVATCVATVDRTNLMPLVIGLGGISLFFRGRTGRSGIARLAINVGLGFAAATFLFVTLSFLRGSLVWTALLQNILGYTVVSFNRMTAILHGSMHYAYEHSGVYAFPLLSQSGTLNQLIPFRDTFNWPTAKGLWRSEFVSTELAGLNPGYIWSGTFGYLFSDLGWGAVGYMFFYGLGAGYFWRRFERGRLSGLIFYPWILFCIVFWIGVNFVLYDRIIHFVEMALVLGAYEQIRKRSPKIKRLPVSASFRETQLARHP